MIASGSRFQLAYVAETVYGTTPATPQTILVPKQSASIDMTKALYDDPTITSDRMEYDERHGNISVGGDVVVTLEHGQFDDWLEAVMGGTWTSNVVGIGTTNRSFTIEQGFLDLARYRVFTGCRFNTLALNINPGSIVSATFGVMGKNQTLATVPLDSTPTAVQAKYGMSHVGGNITVGGVTGVHATALTLNVDNGMQPAPYIGSNTTLDVVWSEATVTGSMTLYFEDITAYNLFVNETSAPVSILVADGQGNSLTFAMPRVKFNTGVINVPNSGMLFIEMSFKALKDATSGQVLTITRSA